MTPLIDGMNLVAKEYVGCQRREPGCRPGVLVLSEFAGAAQELSHALLVNPYDESEVAQAIEQALTMDDARDGASGSMPCIHVSSPTTPATWARRFVDELDRKPAAETGVRLANVVPLADRLADALASGRKAARSCWTTTVRCVGSPTAPGRRRARRRARAAAAPGWPASAACRSPS